MRILALLAFLLIAPFAAADEIQWLDNYAKAEKTGKPVFVYFHSSQCAWCTKMERTAFQDPDLVKLVNEHCTAVKVDAKERDLIRSFGVHSFPTTHLKHARGFTHSGCISAADLKASLNRALFSTSIDDIAEAVITGQIPPPLEAAYSDEEFNLALRRFADRYGLLEQDCDDDGRLLNVEFAIEAYQEMERCPPASDAATYLPDPEIAHAVHEEWYAYLQRTKALAILLPRNEAFFVCEIAQAERMTHFWTMVWLAHELDSEFNRRQNLAEIRRVIGPEAYYGGDLLTLK